MIPLLIAAGGGGMADLSSDNEADATVLYDDVTLHNNHMFTVEAAALLMEHR